MYLDGKGNCRVALTMVPVFNLTLVIIIVGGCMFGAPGLGTHAEVRGQISGTGSLPLP